MIKILLSSLTALGVLSNAYAAPSTTTTTSQQLNDLTQQVQQLEAVINRNQDNAANDPAALLNPNWFQNVIISGELEPTLSWSNRNLIYPSIGPLDDNVADSSIGRPLVQDGSTTDAYLNTANLYLDAQVNNFTVLHTALNYDYDPDQYYSYNSGPNNQELFFSEANVRFANLATSGFYSVIGRQYFNFGSYQHDSLNQTFTDLLSEVNGVGTTVGYASSNGFNVDSYVLNGNLAHRADYTAIGDDSAYISSPKLQTWGASTGYAWSNQTFGVNLQLDFLSNMAQTIYLSHTIAEANFGPASAQTYYSRTPAVFVHSDFTGGPFDVIFDYVTATKRFAATDLATSYNSNDNPQGAKPEATFTQLEYNFDIWRRANATFVAYQTSRNAEAVGSIDMGGYYVPRYRWTVGDNYTLVQNVEIDVEYDHDQDYPNNISNINSGYGYTTESVFAGLDVKF